MGEKKDKVAGRQGSITWSISAERIIVRAQSVTVEKQGVMAGPEPRSA